MVATKVPPVLVEVGLEMDVTKMQDHVGIHNVTRHRHGFDRRFATDAAIRELSVTDQM